MRETRKKADGVTEIKATTPLARDGKSDHNTDRDE